MMRSVNGASTEPHTESARPLVRPREGRLLAGVAVGLADYLGVDPIVFRAAFVVLAFLGGIGIFLYLLSWLMIPPTPSRSPGGERLPGRVLGRVRGRPAWVGVVLLAVGGALVAHRLGVWHPTVFWGVTLVVAGIVLFRDDRGWEDGSRGAVLVEETGAPLPSEAVVAGSESIQPTAGAAVAEPAASPVRKSARRPSGLATRWPFGPRQAAPSSPPRVRRERSALGWLVLGIVLLGLGFAAVLSETDVVHLTLTQFLALALTILGVGLLTGTWLGRARWLIVPGILLVPLVLATSLIDVPITGGIGDRYFNPQRLEELQRTYALTAGDLVIDLTSLRFGAGDVVIDATVAAGTISVLVPDLVSITTRAHAGAGRVAILGQSDQGIRVDVARSSSAPGSIGNLILNLRTGIGQVIVYRIPGEEGSG
jgi:phage shock protein PspC (stress-responsive transcriptional regulator)